MKTVLVVDDELANADILCLLLEEAGYRAHSAVNGRQGLERLAEVRPQLVVLDYMMPIMDGAEMGRAMRASPATRGIRILMSSSLPEDAVRRHFADYDGFLRKPYGIDEALRAIAVLIGE